jgi:hypothetical protein
MSHINTERYDSGGTLGTNDGRRFIWMNRWHCIRLFVATAWHVRLD